MGSIGIYKSAPIEKRIKIARDLGATWHAVKEKTEKHSFVKEWKKYDRGIKKKKKAKAYDIPKEVTWNYIPSCDNISIVTHDYTDSELKVVILMII